MRTFYIFKINNMFQTFYNDKSNILYKMFNEIYNSKEDEILNGFRLFEQITVPFNKKIFNNYISLKHKDDLYYNKKDNKHTINNSSELSRLVVNTTHLKIKTNNILDDDISGYQVRKVYNNDNSINILGIKYEDAEGYISNLTFSDNIYAE